MDELEITQPEENIESMESPERAEEQGLEDATHEPGSRIEETQTFERAEAVEETLIEVMDGAKVEPIGNDGTIDREEYGTVDGSEISEGSGKDDDGGEEATPINLPGPVTEVEQTPDDVKLEEESPAEERGGVLPVPIPEPVEMEDGQELGTLPIPIPEPTMKADDYNQLALSPDDVKLSEEPEPGPDPFHKSADNPGVDGSNAKPIDQHEPPPPDRGNRSEGSDEEGGEVTPINLPQMPEDDNEATPINLP